MRDGLTNTVATICDVCGSDIPPGMGRRWRCRPSSGVCKNPAHAATGGWHTTCMEAGSCRERAHRQREGVQPLPSPSPSSSPSPSPSAFKLEAPPSQEQHKAVMRGRPIRGRTAPPSTSHAPCRVYYEPGIRPRGHALVLDYRSWAQ